MCSIFEPIMENYQGDLADILRASSARAAAAAASYGSTTSSSSEPASHNDQYQYHHWQQQQRQQQHHFSSDPMSGGFSSSVLEDPLIRSTTTNNNSIFGDPFSTMRDPFLHELDILPPYFNTSTTSSSGGLEEAAASFVAAAPAGGVGNTSNTPSPSVYAHHQHHNNSKVLEDQHHDMRSSTIRPCKNIFSNMIQISPNNAKLPLPYDSSSSSPAMAASPRAIKPSAVVSPNTSSKDCLVVDNTSVQISSPRNPGLKRRKNQAKKVVCIPAPAAANSRQTGEVVPSDLWAWRKYGQKPIKGSPYPRGYYRCSSSKGCSARKQVERSRTDPNMLVITYTSEHNHPWPTQRNALAGSTRSQPSKNNAANSKNSSETTQSQKGTTANKPKEEQQQEMSNNSEGNMSPVINAGNSSANSASVKEEMEDVEKQLEDVEKQLESMDDAEFSDGLPNYKPSMMDHQGNNNSEDFFAELGEIEADPLNLLFSQGFNAGGDDQRESKALDPFNIFEWSGDTNTNSFEEHNNKGRL